MLDYVVQPWHILQFVPRSATCKIAYFIGPWLHGRTSRGGRGERERELKCMYFGHQRYIIISWSFLTTNSWSDHLRAHLWFSPGKRLHPERRDVVWDCLDLWEGCLSSYLCLCLELWKNVFVFFFIFVSVFVLAIVFFFIFAFGFVFASIRASCPTRSSESSQTPTR